MSDKDDLKDEDFELLKELFGKPEEQKDIIKVMLQIDEPYETIPPTETIDNKETTHIDSVKKKIKKKEILSQIYETIPLIRENNILLKEIVQNLHAIDFKFNSLMQGPIKIKILK